MRPGFINMNETKKIFELVKKLMGGKASSVLSFGIKGGKNNGSKFIDNLNLIVRFC